MATQGRITAVGTNIDTHFSSAENLWAYSRSSAAYVDTSGVLPDNVRQSRVSDYIAVTPGEALVYQSWVHNSETRSNWLFYTADKTAIGTVVMDSSATLLDDGRYHSSFAITTPDNAAYIRISSRYLDLPNSLAKLERSSSATAWRPATADLQDDVVLLDAAPVLNPNNMFVVLRTDSGAIHRYKVLRQQSALLQLSAVPDASLRDWLVQPVTRIALPSGLIIWRPPRHVQPVRLLLGKRPLIQDTRQGGRGFIAGTASGIVTVGGQPAARRILCIRRDSLRIVRDTWSKPDGTYLLPHLDPKLDYIVMALDHERKWEPVAWDWVKPATADDAAATNPAPTPTT